MAYIGHQAAHEHFRDRVLDGLRQHFPLEGRHQSLHLDNLEVDDHLQPDDLRGQYKAKMSGDTWAAPVHATLTLKNNATGKVIDTRRVKVAEIPQITKRYSYIVGGQEYQMDNQWQLKPGVYTQRRQNGELESRFNVVGRSAFDLVFHPETKQFVMEYNDSKIPLYPIMKAMGVSDASLEQAWGKEILAVNKAARRTAGALDQFAKTTKRLGEAPKDSALHVQEVMQSSKLNPRATELTLGKKFDSVTGEALHRATQQLLRVQAGHPEDDRDSLVFKELRSVGDYAYDSLNRAKRDIKLKVDRKINYATDVRDIIKSDTLNKPLREVFTKNVAARVASQINPAEMISSSLQTTILGPGGIQSEQSVTEGAKLINPSHFGFIDPVNTPEGSKTGITLRLASGVKKVGTTPYIPLYNMKTGKVEDVDPRTALQSKIVLADQVTWKNGKPVPLSSTVKMLGPGNSPDAGKMSGADYVMRRPTHFLNITTNLIPFVNNTNGLRSSYASRHLEQAISLVHREAPLVQAATDVPGDMDTYDKLVGSSTSHRSVSGGVVTHVKPDGITIKSPSGKAHEVQLYNHFPLNDAKSVLHSEPLVKVGDTVKPGQVVADTNFSRSGTLALGTNLRVGFLPYKGYNFDDGLVISDSAAKKLSSQHMYKHEFEHREGTIFDPKRFIIQHPAAYTRDQLKHIGEDGLPQVGTRIRPGDPLIIAMRPYQIKDRTGMGAIRKSLAAVHDDASLRWEGEHEGDVVGVHRSGDKIHVHVRTIERMQVGDKMSNRHGGKGIVTAILPDNEMPHSKDGKHIEVAFNPAGIPGRMNVGQVLEVAAGKIAQKTGNTYVVRNFEAGMHDVVSSVQKELKQHGISDTEELIDPATKKSLGHVLVGPQHMFKLVHQVDKKIAVRPGMTLPGVTSEASYSPSTLQPTGGGHAGGQSIGSLGIYALLAHGAKANLREMQSYKSEGIDPKTNPAKAWPSQHREVWTAIQNGTPLPTPRPTFAFKKFENMLRGAGINVEKKGHEFVLGPLTDKQIIELSNGELRDPTRAVAAKLSKAEDPKPLPGGIFDERITGGHGGNKWSHIALAEPLPNPVFEGPIKHLTGLNKNEYESILYGKKSVSADGKLVPLGQGKTGGAAIKMLLDKLDVTTELAAAHALLKKSPESKVDKVLKKVKYLTALKELGMKTPSDAYILHHLPVLPPSSRPLAVLPSGDIKYDDINGLYREFGQVNMQLKDPTLQSAKRICARTSTTACALSWVCTSRTPTLKTRDFYTLSPVLCPRLGISKMCSRPVGRICLCALPSSQNPLWVWTRWGYRVMRP
jgi:DNA-directed RNA polymerase beta subunit